ncbi:MAG: hypothetical protein IJP74_06920 [Prevotella sp.]|nr:hypothetical protein [Prevotella sp.]
MRKTYKMFLAFALFAMNALTASAIKADLDPAMFKAWDSNLAGANVVAEPEPEPKSNGTFGCSYALYEEVGAYGTIYGSPSVYYLWYADLTGTKTITVKGTAGMQIRMMFNREPYVEGGVGDLDGGAYIEWIETIADNGEVVFDCSAKSELVSAGYIHLNAIKVPNGSPAGTVKAIELEGSIKPVTGWVDILDNGDFEGTELKNFVVALDAVKDQGTHVPTIVDGAGVDGSRAIVVESMDSPAESWQTQFFIKFDEPLPEGTAFELSMDIKADKEAETGSGCHHAPRAWFAGPFFDPNPTFTTEWTTFTYSGVLDAAKAADDGLGSIALDLNVLGEANKYYFDNVSFKVYKESSPISLIKTAYSQDVIRVDFSKETNMKDLVKAAGGQRVVYPNDCAKVMVNGQPTTLMSIEGRPDGYLWIFIDEPYPEGEGEDEVIVSFTNPEDASMRIVYTAGKYEGEAIPNFANMKAEYIFELSENYSYLYGAPAIVSANPEDGSFNLPVDLKEFKFTFDHPVDCAALKVTLGNEVLTLSPSEGFSKEITATRAGGDMKNGVVDLVLSNVKGEKDLGDTGTYEMQVSFGPLNIDPNDQPKDMIPANYFTDCAASTVPEGFKVNFNGEERTSENTGLGSGSRTFKFADGGDFVLGLYFREGFVEYGSIDGHELNLEAGNKYNIHFNTAAWKDNGTTMKFQILDENEEVVVEKTIDVDVKAANVNGNTSAVISGSTISDFSFIPEADGRYFLKWIDEGYHEMLLGNVYMKYVPNVLGIEEVTLLNNALANAKSTRDANDDQRYDGKAFDELSSAITTVEAMLPSLTAPSVYKALAQELDNYTTAMKDHRTLCDTYDPLPAQAYEIVVNNAAKKFANTDIYKNLVAAVFEYGTNGTETQTDPETGEEIQIDVINAKVLKDDAELKTAVEKLQGNITLANDMFTEGHSKVGNWSSTKTGYAVLTDRLLYGVDALRSLGVADDDKQIVAALNALADDDNIASDLMTRVKLELYGKLKDPNNDLFKAVVDEVTLEETTPTYDMTVFVKNPNLYKLSDGNGWKEEALPGWTVISGRGFSTGWDTFGSATIPVDAMLSNWGGDFRAYQTVYNLPAGVYTLVGGYGERTSATDDGGTQDEDLSASYLYAKTSANIDDSLTFEAPRVGQAFPEKNIRIEDIIVTDGVLTIGAQAGATSHVFFNEVQLLLTAPADGFNYANAYDAESAGINETAVAPKKVRAIELFDINGRRIQKAKRGINIMKKLMSDGTVETEKVIIR